jgi:uncharacterized membrane protein YvlD (DUF360 family)
LADRAALRKRHNQMDQPIWTPARLKVNVPRLVLAWTVAAASLLIAVAIVPGAHVKDVAAAFAVTAAIAVLNGLLPPIIAALRLPLTLLIGFVLVLVVDVLMLLLASRATGGALQLDSFWSAFVVALIASAVSTILDTIFGTVDDDTYTLRVTQRIARRSGERVVTDRPGIVFLEIDGLAYPVLQRAIRDGNAPTMGRWFAGGTHRLTEWETDLSSQTGASQCGILLGSNTDVPAFRWVEKERAKLMVCSSPADCAEIERRHLGKKGGLLASGGASRGNLLSGEADHVILTVSRLDEEKSANPGYRAFLANGFNVMRALVLFGWEVVLEVSAAQRAIRRDVRPRGHRGGAYPLMRAAMCIVVRDLIVFGVLSDMMRGRPAIYATFSSYDEVAHHSGLERADTLEALRKLDQQFARIARARDYAPRPYEIVVLSDHGQTQGATFKQRNGYALEDLVDRSLDHAQVSAVGGGDEQDSMVGHAVEEATGRKTRRARKDDLRDREVVVLGSGNLGLVYLMEKQERMTLEEIEALHPRLVPALREHPHVGWILVRSEQDGPVVLGRAGARHLAYGRVVGEDPLAAFPTSAAEHLRRSDGFTHCPDILVGSFYDPALEEGCAFEELISFHGGIGGPQSRAFVLYPTDLPLPVEPLRGAASIHRLLRHWRAMLNGPQEFAEEDLRVAS